MRLCLFHALFTFIFMLALSVNSSTTHNCVNTTWIPKECTVWNGPGTFCVNRTLNPTLCRDRVSLEFIESPINDSDASFAELTDPSYPAPVQYWDKEIPLQIQATMCYMTMNLTLSCPLIQIGAKEQNLMFRQTWNYMLLTELIELKKQPLCSIWAKNEFTRKNKVDKYTVALFRAICKDAVYDGYPKYCPKHEK
ncbi:uncharacterized protein LOC119179190 isoform X2 [Rhipicephalus microplus]|uniref:uncharacterized protein LOC119179190 isoform X2 n=1 Tax=Rhipicephalus microplus TaxID=6941 RepID=UPI003F6AA66A